MPQSLVQDYKHLVFSTKHRYPFLESLEIREALYAYFGGFCREHSSPMIIAGGVEDHVHILCRQSKSISVEDFLRDVKRSSSIWIKKQFPECAEFRWQAGYGVFSISPGHVQELERYIANQEEHHKAETFQDEFRRLLRKYGIEWDERYVWD